MISEIHPLRRNHLAKLAANALFCLKYTCDAAQPVGLGLGLMLGADDILKQANKEPIFLPLLGSMLSVVLHALARGKSDSWEKSGLYL